MEWEWAPNNEVILGFQEKYLKVFSLTIHAPFGPMTKTSEFCFFGITCDMKEEDMKRSIIQVERLSDEYSSRDGSSRFWKSPKFLSPPTSLDSMSFDRARYYKVSLSLLMPPTVLIWEFSSFLPSCFLGSCPHLSNFKIFEKFISPKPPFSKRTRQLGWWSNFQIDPTVIC